MARRISIKGQRRALRKATRIEGLDDLQKDLVKLGSIAGKPIIPVLVEAGQVVKKGVESRVKVRTGLLKSAVFLDASDPFHDPKGPSVLVGVNHRRAPHAFIIEFGSHKQQPQPYFRPGVQASRGPVQRVLVDGLNEALRKIAR